jgi:hypothetical protein
MISMTIGHWEEDGSYSQTLDADAQEVVDHWLADGVREDYGDQYVEDIVCWLLGNVRDEALSEGQEQGEYLAGQYVELKEIADQGPNSGPWTVLGVDSKALLAYIDSKTPEIVIAAGADIGMRWDPHEQTVTSFEPEWAGGRAPLVSDLDSAPPPPLDPHAGPGLER